MNGAITSQYLLEKSRIVFQVMHADIHHQGVGGVSGNVCFLFRPKMKETITSSMRCWQVFRLSRSRLSISRNLRLTITSTRWATLGCKIWRCSSGFLLIVQDVQYVALFCACLLPTQGGDCGITGKDDGEDFQRLLAAMEILHFTPDDQSVIFRVLSSILHLGNVYFEKHQVMFLYSFWNVCCV